MKISCSGIRLAGIIKLLPFQGDFVVSILKPRALPWAKSFCPFRAYGMWLMTHRPWSFCPFRAYGVNSTVQVEKLRPWAARENSQHPTGECFYQSFINLFICVYRKIKIELISSSAIYGWLSVGDTLPSDGQSRCREHP